MSFARWGIPTLLSVVVFWSWVLWILPPGLTRWAFVPVAVFCIGFSIAFFRNPWRKPQGGRPA